MTTSRVKMESLKVGSVILGHQTGNFNQRDRVILIEEANLGRRISMKNVVSGHESFWYAFSGDTCFVEEN